MLEDIGIVRMLSPEQLERKVTAIFGMPWGRLKGQTAMLYGGIDSKEVTERAVAPSGAMGAIQRILANDVACRNVALDFSRKKTERILFPEYRNRHNTGRIGFILINEDPSGDCAFASTGARTR